MGVSELRERALISQLVERLTETYPTLGESTVEAVVSDMHAAFNGSRVREFVPLFVERRSRAALAELAV